MARKNPSPRSPVQVYTLEVALISGPVTESFAEKNLIVARTIEIRGDQTLAQLHEVIFKAFNRGEERPYEFQVGKEPMDPGADRFTLEVPFSQPGLEETPSKGRVHETTVEALQLKVDDHFFYWFDFGDGWWHQITIKAIGETEPRVKYPRITERIGASPPQYPDWDEE